MKLPVFTKYATLTVAISCMTAYCPAMACNKSCSSSHGDKYTGAVTQSDGSKNADTLIFSKGKFRSTACDQYGFGDAHYTTLKKGDVTAFHAETKNHDGNKIVWNGSIIGDEASAVGHWSDKKGGKDTFTFYGNKE